MKKYWHVIGIGIQNTMVYRVNFLCRALFSLVPLVAVLSLWRTIYAGKAPDARIAGYSLASMVSYYLVMSVVDALTAVTDDDWQIAADIKDGNISQFLLKPVNYLGYRMSLFVSGRLVYSLIAVVPLGLFLLAQRQHLVLPPDLATWACFGLSLVLAALLQFLMSFTMALMAFWMLEVSTFIFIVYAFEYLAGGHLFPLDILPPAVLEVLRYTPFPYQLYFPVSVYLGQTTGPALGAGLAMQAIWVGTFFLLARLIWNRGIRKYAAVGG